MMTQRGDGMLGLLWHSAQLKMTEVTLVLISVRGWVYPRATECGQKKYVTYHVFWVQYSYMPRLELRLPVVRNSNSCGDDVANLWDCLHNFFGQFRFSIRKKRPQPVAVFRLSYNTEVTLSYAFVAWDWHSGCFTVSIASCVGHFCSAKCAQPPVEVLIQVY